MNGRRITACVARLPPRLLPLKTSSSSSSSLLRTATAFFPDEAEVLLSPNARFVVTSECTLEVLLLLLLSDVEACHLSL